MAGRREEPAGTPPRWADLPRERLEDDELALEPVVAADVPDMMASVSAGERGISGPGPLDEAATAAFMGKYETGRQRGERLAWTLRPSTDGAFVGGTLLIRRAPNEAELAVRTAPSARGRKHATRALILTADWALGRLGLNRVWLEIDPANAAALRVAAYAGFTPAAEQSIAHVSTTAGDASAGPTSRNAAGPGPTAQDGAGSGRRPHDFVVYERRRLTDPPSGYSVRAARMDDAVDVFALIHRSELHDLGEPTSDLHELRSEWQSLPDFDLAQDTWVILKPASLPRAPSDKTARHVRIVGYAWFQNERDGEVLVGDHCVDPEERDRGLQTVLLDRLEDRARFHAGRTACGVSQMGVFGVSTHDYEPLLFRSRGYRKTREFLRLQLDLTAEPAAPDWPAGICVRTFRRGADEAAVHAALNDSFSEHFRDAPLSLADWERLMFGNPRLDTDIWLVAWDGGEVAGACLNYIYPDTAAGHVEQLGVRRPWRCRGLGTSLLLGSFRLLRDRGCRRVTLGVDTENVTGAARIYERAGMQPQWRTDFYEKSVWAPLGPSPDGHTDAPSRTRMR